MKHADEHAWLLRFSPEHGFDVIAEDPCVDEEGGAWEKKGNERVWCVCAVGLEEPTMELRGEIPVSLEYVSHCTGHGYFDYGCDCGWEFIVTPRSEASVVPAE